MGVEHIRGKLQKIAKLEMLRALVFWLKQVLDRECQLQKDFLSSYLLSLSPFLKISGYMWTGPRV